MGSQNSKFLSQQHLPHQYKPLKQLPGVYYSVINGNRLQKHKIQLNSQSQINYEKDIFIFRRMHSDRIISAYFFQNFAPSHLCNMSYEVCFFTQCPSYTMSSKRGFSFQLGLQLLIECIIGFQILFNKFGTFKIDFDNIFFDNFDQPKVWISSNLGKNRIQKHQKYNITQQKMIENLFLIFDQAKEDGSSNLTYISFLKKQKQLNNNVTFKDTIVYLVDEASKHIQSRNKSLSNGFKSVSLTKPSHYNNTQIRDFIDSRNISRLGQNFSTLNMRSPSSNFLNKNMSVSNKQNTNIISLKNKNDCKNLSKAKNSSHQNFMNKHNQKDKNFNVKSNNHLFQPKFQIQKNISSNYVPLYYCSPQNEINKQFYTRTASSNGSTVFGFSPHYQKYPHPSYNCVHPLIKQKKWKRHNSQQDYINKQYVDFNYVGSTTQHASIFQNNTFNPLSPNGYNKPINFDNKIREKTINTDFKLLHNDNVNLNAVPGQKLKRMHRKSTQQYQIHQNKQIEIKKMEQGKKLKEPKQRERNSVKVQPKQHLYKIVQTQLKDQLQDDLYTERNIRNIYDERKTEKENKKYKKHQNEKQKDKKMEHQKKQVNSSFKKGSNRNMSIHENEKSKNSQNRQNSKKQLLRFQNVLQSSLKVSDQQWQRSPLPNNKDENYMILSNLQTLKSIINSDYSDIDEQIMDDLKNFHY